MVTGQFSYILVFRVGPADVLPLDGLDPDGLSQDRHGRKGPGHYMAVNPLAPDTDCSSVGEQEANNFFFQMRGCDD